jgi:crotonobetainyl-CoA:carnitine CoA-transferase CaiB-like acyl-CoA transferase
MMNCYRAADGRAFWLLGLEADRHFPGLLAAMERQDLAEVENFKNARARSVNAAEFTAVLDAHFATQSYEYWTTRFDTHDVWWAPLNSIAEAVVDEQVLASGAIVDMTPREGEAPYRAVNSPVDFSGYAPTYGPVPSLGEHTPQW